MALLHRMKKVLNPVNTSIPEDDFRILDSWTESDKEINPSKAKMNYLCYKIETIDPETGKKSILYKAVKFARVDRLPKSAKQSTSFMDMQSQVLSAVYEQGYNLVTIIANVIKPTPEGLMDFTGTVDGKTFQNSTGTDINIRVGSGDYCKDVEDQIIGKNIGDKITFKVTMPDDSKFSDAAGKEAEYTVTVKSVRTLPDP